MICQLTVGLHANKTSPRQILFRSDLVMCIRNHDVGKGTYVEFREGCSQWVEESIETVQALLDLANDKESSRIRQRVGSPFGVELPANQVGTWSNPLKPDTAAPTSKETVA